MVDAMSDFPKQIGDYSIDCEIGRGGMGVVYRATDRHLGRSVAIKSLPTGLADNPELIARFEQEAKTLAALNHSNIGGIHGIEEVQGRKYLILEYVDGETLADILGRGPLGVGKTLEICSQIACGLSTAHEAGFVHRDLKPANIKITRDGVAKVLDFGLARALPANESGSPSDETMTTPGTIVGTVRYMSPEQARGEEVDRRTDLWAFGVVLYECLTGTPPFNANSAGECMAAIFSENPDMTAIPGSTPAEVVALIMRCLRKDLKRRPRDAGDCRLILEDAREVLLLETPAATRSTAITDHRFRIDDTLCRTLDRSGFDALLPGWEMQYADNNRESTVLILWIPSIGGDHTTPAWRELMAASPYRMITVCPVGMEPGVANRPVVSIENQFALIRALTAKLRGSLGPERTVISGFSCGSIMALRCAAGDSSGELFDGVLTIDADMQQSDCFLTRLFAGLDGSSSTDVLKALHEISKSCETLHQWLSLHQHMVECVDKMKTDFSPLIQQGIDLSVPFENVHNGENSPFVDFFRNAIENVTAVQCVFHDSAENRRMLGEIRLRHLDTGCLGPNFSDESLSFIQEFDHTSMMSTERLLENLELIVRTLRDANH